MAGGADIGSGIGGLVGGIAVLAGAAGKNGDKYRKQALEAWQKLKASDFDFRSLSPPELKVVAQAYPQVYDAIVPDSVKTIIESPEDRAAQVTALGQQQDIAANGTPLVDRLSSDEAVRQMAGQTNRANEDVLHNLAARGQLGAGDELQARLSTNQMASDQAAQVAASMARDRALQRMSAVGQAANQAGALRSADVNTQAQNANYVNNFNNLAAQLKNNAAQYNAGAKERAQGYNTQTAQDIANVNEQNKYNTDLANLTRQNSLKGANTSENIQIASGMSNALGNMANAQDAEQQRKAQAIVGVGQGVGGIGGSFLGF